ncbi:MAG: biotin--[acetyl-CoA-carboxylase] ligase [Halobacteriota archaeon]|nr:biotin--[acetyl-CoA-carboxylase] ligase [Halobacteriota archaeon]
MSVKPPDSPFSDEIKQRLETEIFGRTIYHFDKIDSTNRMAKDLAIEGAGEGTVIIAEEQTHGRGRLGRSWVSPLSSVLLSIILRPQVSPTQAHMITLMAGIAAAKTIRRYDIDARIKWPNDVLIDGRKVCGILTEISAAGDNINFIIIGIGINVNVDIDSFPIEIRKRSTSLKAEVKKEISRVEFVQLLLKELEDYYNLFKEQNFVALSRDWKESSDTLNRWVQVTTPNEVVEGKAIDISQNGALIIRLRDGALKTILTGDCMHCVNGRR